MPQGTNVIINDFRGGINSQDAPEEILDNQLVDSMNMELVGTVASRRPGVALAESGVSAIASLTSLLPFVDASGNRELYLQYGTSIIKSDANSAIGSFVFTDAIGGQTIDASSDFRYTIFDDVMYIVSGTGTNNGFSIATAGGNLAAWTDVGSHRNDGTDIASWGRRIFQIERDEPNVVQWSRLGDALDWEQSGASGGGWAAVGADEPGELTTLYPWNGWLWLFKQQSIYALIPSGRQEDATTWEFKKVISGFGTEHKRSIVEAANDLFFFDARNGIVSLTNALNEGSDNPRRAIYSIKVPELGETAGAGSSMAGMNYGLKQQVWWSDDANDVTWVMDYSNLGLTAVDAELGTHVSWWKWDGGVVGTDYVLMYTDSVYRPVIAGSDHVYILDPSVFNDETIDGSSSVPSAAVMLTKAYSLGAPLIRKEWLKFGVEFEVSTTDADVYVTMRPDGNEIRDKLYTLSVSGGGLGSRLGSGDTYWNDGLTNGSFYLGGGSELNSDFVLNLRGGWGRRAESMQVKIQEQTANVNKHFSVKRLLWKVAPIGTYLSDDIS
jgi:hypothetical protein